MCKVVEQKEDKERSCALAEQKGGQKAAMYVAEDIIYILKLSA